MTWRSLLLAVLIAAAVSLLPQMVSQQKVAAASPAAQAAARPAANALGLEVRHIHIRVMDVERTKAFYRDKLGFKVTHETPTVVEFKGLWFGKWTGQGTLVPQGVSIGLAAKSVDAAYQVLKGRGVNIPTAPAQAHGAWSFTFKDPDGYEVEVEGPK